MLEIRIMWYEFPHDRANNFAFQLEYTMVDLLNNFKNGVKGNPHFHDFDVYISFTALAIHN